MTESSRRELAFSYLAEGKEALKDAKWNKAALLLQNAIHLFEQLEDFEQLAYCKNMLGVIYAAAGNESAAIDCYLSGLEVAREHGIKNLIALFENNIGSCYQDVDEHKKAICYFERSVEWMQYEEVKQDPNYSRRALITYMNLLHSYNCLGEYDKSQSFVLKVEPLLEIQGNESYRYPFLVHKCMLYWSMGEKEYVYSQLQYLMDNCQSYGNTWDYMNDMKLVCKLLDNMGEAEKWKTILGIIEQYVDANETVYLRLAITELWMDYFRAMGDQKQYADCCIRHAELYGMQKKIANRERAAAIGMKIDLQTKEEERRTAEQQSNTDFLTGLGSRYKLEKDFRQMLLSGREGETFGIAVLDIDCFKEQNDTYGHLQGDECLTSLAEIFREILRERGEAYRYGGDEFVLLLPGMRSEDLGGIGARIKEELEKLHVANINSRVSGELTISQGYACCRLKRELSFDDALKTADQALYEVKRNGRNGYMVKQIEEF